MRITLINRFYAPDQSATAQLLTDLAVHLAAQGEQVQIITSRLDYAAGATQWPRQEVLDGVLVRRVATTGFGRAVLKLRALDYLSFYLSALIAVLRWVRAGDLVVVKTDPPLLAVALLPALWLKRSRLVNWLQDLYPEVAERLGVRLPRVAWAMLRGARDFSLRRAVLNVVLGERMAEQLAAVTSKVKVLPNWSIQATPIAEAAQNPLRAALGLSDELVIGYSGNLGRAHDYRTILLTARALKAHPEIQFLVIGGGAGKVALEAAAAHEQLPNLHFLPYQPLPTLTTSLRAIDLHLVSLNPEMEGLIVPSKIYGILAAGRPTLFLGDPDGEIARLLARFQAGFTLPPDDLLAIVQLLQSLAGDRDGLQQMGQNAATAHHAHFARERALANWTKVIGSC